MRVVNRQALVPYTPAQMYALVNGIARYPEFVPWCPETAVLEESATSLRATLTIARAGVRVPLTTQNSMVPDASVQMSLVDGPLAAFDGRWEFVPIVDSHASNALVGCKVILAIRYEFRNAALGVVFGPLFEVTWNSLVDAFVARAHAVYGG